MGFEPGSPELKTNALTTEPKSRLPDAVCQRLYLYHDALYRKAVLFIVAMHYVICQPDVPMPADYNPGMVSPPSTDLNYRNYYLS